MPKNKILDRVIKSPRVRVRIFGFVLIVISLFFIIRMYNNPLFLKIGIGGLLIGIFAIFVITENIVPKTLDDAMIHSNTKLIHSLISGLKLEGNGIYIPAGNNLSDIRVFVPLKIEEEYHLDNIDDNSTYLTGSDNTSLGVVFVPPGLDLLKSIEIEGDVKSESLEPEILAEGLSIITRGYGILGDIDVSKGDNNEITLKLIHSNYRELCSRIRKDMDSICRQTSCPICSTVLCALTRSVGKQVTIKNFSIEKDTIIFNIIIGG